MKLTNKCDIYAWIDDVRSGTQHGKPVQCNIGANNHAVAMPDANRDQALDALLGAACGGPAVCISVDVHPRAECGPVTTPIARARIEALIASAEDRDAHPGEANAKSEPNPRKAKAKAKILLDGRGVRVPTAGVPRGQLCGRDEYRRGEYGVEEEIFGPVLCVLSISTLDAAIAVLNANPFGNGAAIFTQSSPKQIGSRS
ncbi:Aldehyde/histidinol dehydrogenase [Mycena galopus ATCC 62051]|nr:Aldehyde/histidinol dehydrogenase [Mycena galopus ATCC 62051]